MDREDVRGRWGGGGIMRTSEGKDETKEHEKMHNFASPSLIHTFIRFHNKSAVTSFKK